MSDNEKSKISFDGVNIGRAKIISPIDKLRKDLEEMREDVIKIAKRTQEMEDMENESLLKCYINNIDNIKNGVDKISKKYGWDK